MVPKSSDDAVTLPKAREVAADPEHERRALNHILEQVIGLDSPEQSLEILAARLGQLLLCDRVVFCGLDAAGAMSVICQWHSPDAPVRELTGDDLQLVARHYASCALGAHDRLHTVETATLARGSASEQELAALLERMGVRTQLACDFRYLNQHLGFFALDNPAPYLLKRHADDLPLLAYSISALLNSRRLVTRLENQGLIDELTGAGNRQAFYEFTRSCGRGSLGVLLGNVNDIRLINENEGHQAGDRVLKSVASCMIMVFGAPQVFRIGSDEFICIARDLNRPRWDEMVAQLRLELARRHVYVALGETWQEQYEGSFDDLIRGIDRRMYDDKRHFYAHAHSEDGGYHPSYDLMLRIDALTQEYRVLEDLTGMCEGLEMPANFGEFLHNRLKSVHHDDRPAYRGFWNLRELPMRLRRHRQGRSLSVEYRLRSEGGWRWHEDVLVLFERDEQCFLLCLVRSVSGAKAPDPAAPHGGTAQLNADILLPVNEVFMQLADEWLAQARMSKFAVLAIDINFFKLYNEIYGRKAGNLMLERVAAVSARAVERLGGVAGYMGGDNFCMMFPTDGISTAELERDLTTRIRQHHFPPGFSLVCGVCESDDRSTPALSLYDRALVALANVKGSYTQHVSFYDASKYKRQRDMQVMLIGAQRGFRDGEFTFYVQPKVNIHNGRVVSSEALVRWVHGGIVHYPGEFVGAMEQSGYIYAIDRFIWEEVCRWQRSLLDRGLPALPVSVNVSRLDFYFCDVAECFVTLLNRYQLKPSHIEIEVTESAYSEDENLIRAAIKRLHMHGFRILLDDFGNGYSSLSMLRSTDVDIIKIDKRFLDVVDTKAANYMLIDSVVNLAHMLDMYVIAEGVETAAQCERLKEMNCNLVQGYYFYKPMSQESFETLIADPGNIAEIDWALHKQVGVLNYRHLFNEHMLSDEVVNRILGAVAIFEVTDTEVHLVQMNQSFIDATGISPGSRRQEQWMKRVPNSSLSSMRSLLLSADKRPGNRVQLLIMDAHDRPRMALLRIYPMAIRENRRFFLAMCSWGPG